MSNILQSIFLDHYEQMLYQLYPRQTETDNVNKMIHCGGPSYGGAFYACPDYGELKLFLFVASPASVLPVEINIIKCALFTSPAS